METILNQNHFFTQPFLLSNRSTSEPLPLPNYSPEFFQYVQENDPPNPYVNSIEDSAWAEHLVNNQVTPHSSPVTEDASTENSVCANNGSFDEGLPGCLSECFQNCMLDNISEKAPVLLSERKTKGRYKRNPEKVIMEAKMRLKKLFLRYLYSKEARIIIKQEIRHNELLKDSKFKELRTVLVKLMRRSPYKRLRGCICCNDMMAVQHSPMCMIMRKLWIVFLDKTVQGNVSKLTYVSGTMRKIILRIATIFEKCFMETRE